MVGVRGKQEACRGLSAWVEVCNGLLGGLRLLPWVATVVEGGVACWSEEKGGLLGPLCWLRWRRSRRKRKGGLSGGLVLGLSCGRVSAGGALASGAVESLSPGGPTPSGPTPLSPRLLLRSG